VQVDGKRRDIGLGSVDLAARSGTSNDDTPIDIPLLHKKILTLSEAREKAGLLRVAAKAGLDPVAERDRTRRSVPRFSEAAIAAHTALKSGWTEKGGKTFIRSLETHAFPVIGQMRVDMIAASDITDAIQPIWTAKPDMARKIRQRIGMVLNFSHSKGWRPTEAPGRSVTMGLPRQPKGGNYDSMPYANVPDFVARLRSAGDTQGRLALLFLIFTAARPGEVRAARWGQIDLEARNWNRPSEIMKGVDAPPHTVTLNAPAIELLNGLLANGTPKPGDLIFRSPRGGKLSDMTMNKVLRDMKLKHDAHGFRSSFRDWAAEKAPETPDPVAEAALSHIVSDKVIGAYKRTKFVELRRGLLERWGKFVAS
jgi:integrase